jgi:hypothetical protein
VLGVELDGDVDEGSGPLSRLHIDKDSEGGVGVAGARRRLRGDSPERETFLDYDDM